MLKPIKKSREPFIFENKGGVAMTAFAEDVLFHSADIMSEGMVEEGAGLDPVYNGSTMITFHLERLNRGGMKMDDFARLLTAHMQRSVFFRIRMMRMVRQEAEFRCAPRVLGEVNTAPEFRIDGSEILVDIDVIGVAKQGSYTKGAGVGRP